MKPVCQSPSDGAKSIDTTLCLKLLSEWAIDAEHYWYWIPGNPELGVYGTGYNHWGVQTNQKYLSAMAVLGVLGEKTQSIRRDLCRRALRSAMAAFRFSLCSHVTGDCRCTDGTQWGNTWISALGIERMMHGVHLLEPKLTDKDHSDLRLVLTSEADWLLSQYCSDNPRGVVADPWARSGKNAPESNLWNGAILWRTAVMYPDHPHAGFWKEKAHRFLINAVSVATDASDERILSGKAIREWHVGANFFPNYALDHHGYFNVGYMVICLSNAAMLHFDMQAIGLPAPESLYHHHADLWKVLRRMIFSNGRLARIGGDSRVRYAYCQEYLLPVLIYAADRLGEKHAAHLIGAQLELIQEEAEFNGNGSFYGKRLSMLAGNNPYYYTRLESDRACVLGMAATYLGQIQGNPDIACSEQTTGRIEQETQVSIACKQFEQSVAGEWCDPDHGAVLHRSPSRLAAFAWRAFGLAQGSCLPPDDGHLAEWEHNLGGLVRFLGDDDASVGGHGKHRKLIGYSIDTFNGGFITCGSVIEGVNINIAEGYHGEASAIHQIAFAALPDGHTVIGFQYCRTLDHRTYVTEVKGLHFNMPNDLYNRFNRRLVTRHGELSLHSPPDQDEIVDLASTWTCIDGRLGVVGLYGAKQLVVHRARRRRGGKYASLYVDEICFPCTLGTRPIEPSKVVIDVGWAVLSNTNSDQTNRFAQLNVNATIDSSEAPVRGVRVQGLDERHYVGLVNFDGKDRLCTGTGLFGCEEEAYDLATGKKFTCKEDNTLVLKAGQARVFVLSEFSTVS